MGLDEGIRPEHILVLRMMVALPLFAATALFFRQLKSSALSMRDFVFVSVVSVAGMGLVLSSVYLLKRDNTPVPPPAEEAMALPADGAFQDSRSL